MRSRHGSRIPLATAGDRCGENALPGGWLDEATTENSLPECFRQGDGRDTVETLTENSIDTFLGFLLRYKTLIGAGEN